MNRRNFLRMMVGGIAASAAAEVVPLGRVWSFPSKIIIPKEITFYKYLLGSDAVITSCSDFVAMSDVALDATIEKAMSYRLALSLNQIVRTRGAFTLE